MGTIIAYRPTHLWSHNCLSFLSLWMAFVYCCGMLPKFGRIYTLLQLPPQSEYNNNKEGMLKVQWRSLLRNGLNDFHFHITRIGVVFYKLKRNVRRKRTDNCSHVRMNRVAINAWYLTLIAHFTRPEHVINFGKNEVSETSVLPDRTDVNLDYPTEPGFLDSFTFINKFAVVCSRVPTG